MFFLAVLAGVFLAGGVAYLLLAHYHLFRFQPQKPGNEFLPPATVLIPAHGAPPELADCLATLFDQDYPDFQIVFGLHSPDDPARPVIEATMAAHPERDTALVIDPRRIGANPKNCNLANMMRAAKHDILVMVDSDVLVERDFLRAIVHPLADPAVGATTCLYKAVTSSDLPSRLEALFINDWFVPSVLVDLARREMDICYGAAIAVTRASLDAVGGFAAMADAVAQDYVFAHAMRANGYKIRLAPSVVDTVASEPDFKTMFLHELRWNRAVRAVRPLEHLLSVFMSTLTPAAILMFCAWPLRYALAGLALHLALRVGLHGHLRLRLTMPPAEPWLVPVREVLNTAVWLAALAGRKIRWGQSVMVTGDGLSMRTDGGDKSSGSGSAKLG